MTTRETVLTACNRAGLTPMGVVVVTGLGLYAAVATAVMGGCYWHRGYDRCEPAAERWQRQMGMVGAGFVILFTKAPGTQVVAGALAALAGGAAAGGAARSGRQGDDAIPDPREDWGQVLDAAGLMPAEDEQEG